jgi:glycosyltransferase involved in cell wall biosynthesis
MSEHKKILVITSTFPRWQGDKEPPFVYELSRRLSRNFSIHILAPHAENAALHEKFDTLVVTRFPYFFKKYQTLAYNGGILSNLKQNHWRYGLVPFFAIAQFFALIRLLRKEKFDAIHAHWIIPQGLIGVLARFFITNPPPLLCTSHGGDLFALRGKLFEKIKKIVLNQSIEITVVSQTMRESVLNLGISNEKIHVIPMGVDIENRFIPNSNKRRENSLLFVGRLVEKKGLHDLLTALPFIIAKHPSVTLTIVGTGPDEAALKKRSTELALNRSVMFLGAIENNALPALYQSSEIVVFPSIIAADGDREGFGLVLVEALACECAAVVSDLPAMQDIVIDNESALIFQQKNPTQLAEKIIQLLDNTELRHSLGKQGRQTVLARYDWEIIAQRYSALIKKIL